MRVVWAWSNYRGEVIRDGKLKSAAFAAMLLGSIATWKAFYPEDETCLYTDRETLEGLFVEGSQYEHYLSVVLNKVTVVDFQKEKEKLGVGDNVWAFPKIYAASLQKEPFLQLDVDMLLNKPFKEFLDLNKIWVYNRYWLSTGREGWWNLAKEQVQFSWENTGKGIHSCAVYFPNPLLPKILLQLSCAVQRNEEAMKNWRGSLYAEEGLLDELITHLKLSLENTYLNSYMFHGEFNCKYFPSKEDFLTILERYLQNLPEDLENWLSKEELISFLKNLFSSNTVS